MSSGDPKTQGDPQEAAPEPPEGKGGSPVPPPPPPEGPPQTQGDPETLKMGGGGGGGGGGRPQSGVLGRPPPPRRSPARTRLRNRRFAALRQLIRDGEYFSEEEMRAREPLLYRHYIGRFRGGAEENFPGDPPVFFMSGGGPSNPPPPPPHDFSGAPPSLSGLLLRSVEEAAVQQRLRRQLQRHGDSTDEEGDPWTPDEAERAMLREEFTTRMYQRFLDGEDGDFDYSQVDENPDLDNLDIVSRDAEERYFDEEEPSAAPPLL